MILTQPGVQAVYWNWIMSFFYTIAGAADPGLKPSADFVEEKLYI